MVTNPLVCDYQPAVTVLEPVKMVTTTRVTKRIETPLDPKAIKVLEAALSMDVDEESGEVVQASIHITPSHDDDEVQRAADKALRQGGFRQ